MFNPKIRNYKDLKKIAATNGAVCFGACRTADLKDDIDFMSKKAVEGLDYGISAACKLSSVILEDIKDGPTQLYYFHYRRINMLLDRIALLLSGYIERKGYRALPVAASQILDWKNQRGLITHKSIAQRAGLGWIGRNNLLVNENFGSQVRLVSVLTDMPLRTDKPATKDCGNCYACVDACPVKAIKNKACDFDRISCYGKLDEFKKTRNIGQHICGICVKACNGY